MNPLSLRHLDTSAKPESSHTVGKTRVLDKHTGKLQSVRIEHSNDDDYTDNFFIKDRYNRPLGSMLTSFANDNAMLDIIFLDTKKPITHKGQVIYSNEKLYGLGKTFIQLGSELSHLLGLGGALSVSSMQGSAPFYHLQGFNPASSPNPDQPLKGLFKPVKAYYKAMQQYKNSGQRFVSDPAENIDLNMTMRDSSRKTDQHRYRLGVPLSANLDGKRFWINKIEKAPILFETAAQLKNGHLILD